MKISAELSPQCLPEEIDKHVKLIEGHGFYRIWVRDMIIAPWELWTALSQVVSSTSKIRIGIDVTNAYSRSPVVTAHAAATMDRISGGRLDLGFGRGIVPFLMAMGLEMHPYALEECVKIVRSLLTGEKLSYEGQVFRITEVKLPLTPHQRSMPIFLAATDEETLKLAGRISDGILTISAHEMYLRKAKEWIEDSGRREIPLSTWLPFSMDKGKIFSYLQTLKAHLSQDFFELMGMKKEELEDKDLLKDMAILGTDDLVEKLQKLENLGVSELIIEYLSLEDLQAFESSSAVSYQQSVR